VLGISTCIVVSYHQSGFVFLAPAGFFFFFKKKACYSKKEVVAWLAGTS
jgi:hypothetical protein